MKILDQVICYSYDEIPRPIKFFKVSFGTNYKTNAEIIRWLPENELLKLDCN